MSFIHSINHVQLPFPAVAEARVRHFYGTLLRLPEVADTASRTLRFAVGEQRVELVPADTRQPVSAASHLALTVADLPALRKRLLDADLSLVEHRAPEGHLRFYVKDPAGNQLEFLEPGPAVPSVHTALQE